MNHTPAPWHVTNDGEFVDHGQAALIRAVNANEADMKLIAAAPELLSALKAVLPLVKHTDDNGWHQMKFARDLVDKLTA